MEVEFVAFSQVSSELIGMHELVEEVGISTQAPMVLHVDSQATFQHMVGEDAFGKAEHIGVCLKFIKDFVSMGVRPVVQKRQITTRPPPAEERQECGR
ncbi:hypothetical protein PI125_g19220 [Phytophthora idaei]|nr:hypothetical protein PI125_g19220 [Phytophthora idaei]